MTSEECVRSVFLILSFFSNDELSQTLVVKFLIGFLKYVFFFFFKTSYFYFKSLSILFIWYKTLFFTNLVPSILQVFLSFHFMFNYIWDFYLLFSVYSVFLVCLPYYAYKFNKEKISNISVSLELKVLILLAFFLIITFEYAFLIAINLIVIELVIRKRETKK
jgi:hypothetical protein